MHDAEQLTVIRTYGEPQMSSYDYIAVKAGVSNHACPSIYQGNTDMVYKAMRAWMISIINDIEAGG